jgi:shikimate kinase
MSYCIIIRGPAGVGKSTIARDLAKKLDSYYVSFDSVMKKNMLDTIKEDGISSENFIKANNLVIPEAIKRLKTGQIVIFDGCFYRKEQIKHLKEQIKFRFLVFNLTASLNECLKRNESRNKIMPTSEVVAVYDLVTRLKLGINIKTSGKNIPECVDELVSKSRKFATIL